MIEGRLGPAGVRPGVDCPALASALEQSGDGGDIDSESCGELPTRAFAAIDCVEDALAEIVGQRFYGSQSFHVILLSSRVPNGREPL